MPKISVNASRISSGSKLTTDWSPRFPRFCMSGTNLFVWGKYIFYTWEAVNEEIIHYISQGVRSVRVLIEEQFFVTQLLVEGTRIAHFGKFWWVHGDIICIKCVSWDSPYRGHTIDRIFWRLPLPNKSDGAHLIWGGSWILILGSEFLVS